MVYFLRVHLWETQNKVQTQTLRVVLQLTVVTHVSGASVHLMVDFECQIDAFHWLYVCQKGSMLNSGFGQLRASSIRHFRLIIVGLRPKVRLLQLR